MKPIHNLLRQRLYRTRKPFIEHPPTDLLGAFAEKALSGSDRAPVLEHLAQCGECREVVFLASGRVQSDFTGHIATERPSPARWNSWPLVRWGTVAACAAILVFAVRLHPRHQSPQTEVAIAAAANPGGAGKESVEPAPENDRPSGETAFVNREDEEPSSGSRDQFSQEGSKPVLEFVNLKYDDDFYRQMALSTDEVDTERPPRWSLTGHGILERSIDGGMSWSQIRVGNEAHAFRAISASGQSVWVGGEKGILFHSTDAGRHWTRIDHPAEHASPATDIVGIEFQDERHGKLTTANRESWVTSDAGHTWEIR